LTKLLRFGHILFPSKAICRPSLLTSSGWTRLRISSNVTSAPISRSEIFMPCASAGHHSGHMCKTRSAADPRPGPESRTETSMSPDSSTRDSTQSERGRSVTGIMASMPFMIKFSRTCCNWTRSASTCRSARVQGTGPHSSVQVDSETRRVPGEQILAVVLAKRRFRPALLPGATQNRTLENSASNSSSRFLGASRLEPLGASLFKELKATLALSANDRG
jgi:hypothetical protein